MHTQPARKQLICALAFIGLGVLSGAASAQSAEYRRGYDQGYREGMAAAQARDGRDGRDGRDYGHARGRIQIMEALWGVREASCDARDAVRQIAGRFSNPSITANNQLCGDPAPRTRKRLTVTYRCGDSQLMRAEADEGDSLTLNCQ